MSNPSLLHPVGAHRARCHRVALGFVAAAGAAAFAADVERLPPFAVPGQIVEAGAGDSVGLGGLSAEATMLEREFQARLEKVGGGFVGNMVSPRLPTLSLRGSRETINDELADARGKFGLTVDDIPVADLFGRSLAALAGGRMTVFKSPRGAEIGVPHSAGLIEVQSRLPGPKWSGEFVAGAGERGARGLTGDTSGPVAEGKAGLGLAFSSTGQDGDYFNSTTGRSYGERRADAGRVQLRLTPRAEAEILVTVGTERSDDDTPTWVGIDYTRSPWLVAKPQTGRDVRAQNYQALRAIWDDRLVRVKSITSHRRFTDDFEDPSFLAGLLPFPSRVHIDQRLETWSQEVRAESVAKGKGWQWRTGGFWSETDFSHRLLQLPIGDLARRTRSRDLALYAKLAGSLAPGLRATGGLRWQSAEVDTRSTALIFGPPPGIPLLTAARDRAFSALLPTIELDRAGPANGHWTVRYAAGQQPGGGRRATPGAQDYDAETSHHFEAGPRFTAWAGRLVAGATVFHTLYRDYQSQQTTPVDVTVANARRAQASGVDLQLRWRPADEWELFADGTVTRARFDEFRLGTLRLDGNRMSNVPAYAGTLGAEYRGKRGGRARLDGRFVGRTPFDETGAREQPAFATLGMRVGFERGRWGVFVYGRNVLDEHYYNAGLQFLGAWVGVPGARRQCGIEASGRF